MLLDQHFRPFRNVYLTWQQPRIYWMLARPSRHGHLSALQGASGAHYFQFQPLAEEEVPEPEDMEKEVPEEGEEKAPEEDFATKG